jgi:YrbI family 3-deoxy-D-manno-octulosonate 8-phosphate phosphatase
MLFENINYLLRDRGALPLSGEGFLALGPEGLWDIVSQLGYSFETLNTVDLGKRARLLKAVDIKLVVLDVDGVMTDGGLMYNSHGEETKRFDVKDGMAITRAIAAGTEVGIISAASRSEVVNVRAEILGIKHVYVGKKPKIEVLEEWLYTMGLGFENVAYIGDDINDVAILQKVGLSAAPADAMPEARHAAKVVLRNPGGRGCLREFFDTYILKS